MNFKVISCCSILLFLASAGCTKTAKISSFRLSEDNATILALYLQDYARENGELPSKLYTSSTDQVEILEDLAFNDDFGRPVVWNYCPEGFRINTKSGETHEAILLAPCGLPNDDGENIRIYIDGNFKCQRLFDCDIVSIRLTAES